jgi:hypothetical protein
MPRAEVNNSYKWVYLFIWYSVVGPLGGPRTLPSACPRRRRGGLCNAQAGGADVRCSVADAPLGGIGDSLRPNDAPPNLAELELA